MMGLLGFLKKDSEAAPKTAAFPITLEAPAKGTFVPMEQIPDEVFSGGVLGMCCGVDPEEGTVFAPVDGKISQVANSSHAIGIEVAGIDLLIHVGVDTVEMNGDGFQVGVKVGQNVEKGEPLLTMDLQKIHDAGHPATVIMAVTNTDDFSAVESIGSGSVQPGDGVLKVSKQ